MKRVATFQIQERIRTLRQDEEVCEVFGHVNKVRKEMQQKLRAFARKSGQTGRVYRLGLVLRPLLTPSSPWQPQQHFLRRSLRTRLEVIRDINLGALNFKAKGGLTQTLENELKGIASSARTGKFYRIEMQLCPLVVGDTVSQNKHETRGAFEQQEGYEHKTQRCPADHKVVAPFIDAETQKLPDPVKLFDRKTSTRTVTAVTNAYEVCKPVMSPSLVTEEMEAHMPSPSPASTIPSAPDCSGLPLKLADFDKELGIIQPNPPAWKAEPEDKAVPQAVDSHNIGEHKSEEDLKDVSKSNVEGAKVPVKETVTRVVARKKEQPANNGPDHFLSLLDLVRKK